MRAPVLAVTAPLLLAAAPQTYAPERAFTGVYTASFEHSEFAGCWLSFGPQASKTFFGQVDHDKYWGASYRISFTGRSTPRLKLPTRGKGYGHVGAYPCEIQVTQLRSVTKVVPAKR